VWRNYADARAARLLLAEAVESAAGLDRIREAVPGAAIVVCRLRADLETMRRASLGASLACCMSASWLLSPSFGTPRAAGLSSSA
jgi:hypothetical protein